MKTKELTIEEKAKAYDRALANAKEQAIDGYLDAVAVNDIFPEFKESEDEDILKGLISMCKTLGKTKWIAWLEKQGEEETLCDKCKKGQPSHYCQDITALGRCALEKQGEQKPAEWSKEDKRNFDIIYGIIYNSCIAEDASRLNAWLLSLRPQKQWKPSLAQLNALSIVSKGNAPDDIEAIVSLYNDLKKLKG